MRSNSPPQHSPRGHKSQEGRRHFPKPQSELDGLMNSRPGL